MLFVFCFSVKYITDLFSGMLSPRMFREESFTPEESDFLSPAAMSWVYVPAIIGKGGDCVELRCLRGFQPQLG